MGHAERSAATRSRHRPAQVLGEPPRIPRLYSYVVARDYGFAPNPFFGVCTLATCKPLIRRHARVGDWVVGTGSKRYGLDGRVVFVMEVAECLTFNDYWQDRRFRRKRPNLRGSIKQAFGDNIYHRHRTSGRWIQADSHHSREGGRANRGNVRHDTQVDRVLIAPNFIYWGAGGPRIPSRLRREGRDVCIGGQGHKCRFPDSVVRGFIEWIGTIEPRGYVGEPREFARQGTGTSLADEAA